jgi:hypothetical protein
MPCPAMRTAFTAAFLVGRFATLLGQTAAATAAAPTAANAPTNPTNPTNPTTPAPPAATAAPTSASGGDTVTEVTVHGSRLPSRDAGSDRVQAQEARGIPGTFGEPLQAVEALPGVSPMVSGLPYFYVRGAAPADTGYFLDGIPLPALYHIGPGPSVVPAPLLDHIDFFASNAPAEYGRYVGGVISAQTTEPSPVARGEGSVRLFDAAAFVETPLDDGRSSVLVAGRYGYPDLLLSIFAPNLTLGYGDYTTRLTRSLSPSDTISLFAIGGYDHEQDASQDLVPVSTQFHRVDLRFDHRWAAGSVRLATTFGYDSTSDIATGVPGETATSVSGRLRVELEQRFGDAMRLSAGADANGARSSFEVSGDPLESRSTSQVAGAYVDVRVRPVPWIEIAPGVRADAYLWSNTSAGAVDPKLTARVAFTPELTWVSTFGVAHQPPTYLFPVPGLIIDASQGLQRSDQMSEGVEATLPWSMKGRLTGFYNVVHNMNDFVSDCGTFAQACSAIDRVDGRTYGLEMRVERALSERLGGWVSYTLSRAERRIGDIPYLSPFDRTHVVSAVVRYDFGRAFSAGVRGTYYTGRPDFPTFAFGPETTFSAGPGQIAQHRLPPFYRVDLRADHRWELGRGRWLTAVAEFFDVTLAKEAIDFRCGLPLPTFLAAGGPSATCTAQQIGPIALPSIGLEGGF